MLRWLRRDFRDYPATMAICTLWIVVYAAMLATSVAQGNVDSWSACLLGTPGGERFGDMSLQELARGEYWRTLTSTFVHYGLIHLAMNLFGMYQLGSLIEEWYGRWQTLPLYVIIGAGGNTVSALIRHALGSQPYIHSGGGSTVLLGFVGLCAIVGWRARTRMGDFLRGQMVAILIYTALLGLALPVVNYFVPMPLIDNWGHAGGALMGAIAGFAHAWLDSRARSRLAAGSGVLAILVLVACATLQWRADRRDSPRRAQVRLVKAQATLGSLARVGYEYETDYRTARAGRLFQRGRFVGKDRLKAIGLALAQLAAAQPALDNGTTRADFRQVRGMLEEARNSPPSRADVEAFARPFHRLAARARRNYDRAAAEFVRLAPRDESKVSEKPVR